MRLQLIDLSKHKHFKVTQENRVPIFTGLGLFFLVLYLFTNRYPLNHPQVMNQLDWERGIPLIPWTAWIYVSDYVYPVVIGFLIRTNLVRTRVALAFLIQSVVANGTFYFFPISFPRELWPHAPTDFLMEWIRYIDQANNCFPSAHVAIVALAYVAWIRENPSKHWVFSIWGLLICLSTLTTKQHYFADILAGIVVGGFSYVAAERLIVESNSAGMPAAAS